MKSIRTARKKAVEGGENDPETPPPSAPNGVGSVGAGACGEPESERGEGAAWVAGEASTTCAEGVAPMAGADSREPLIGSRRRRLGGRSVDGAVCATEPGDVVGTRVR